MNPYKMSRMNCGFASVALIILLFCGCSASETGSDENSVRKTAAFFDLDDWFQNEAKRLSALDSVIRTITLDGRSETKSVAIADWKQELRPFIYSDINRAGWADRYAGDTILSLDKKIRAIHYQALDEKLRVREIDIQFGVEGKVRRIEIAKKRKSLIVENEQQLTYIPEEGYSLMNSQSTPISNKQEMKISVKWE